MQNKVMLILPKLSAYKNKDANLKYAMERAADEWLQYVSGIGMSIHMFAEDMLAVELFQKNPDIKWVTTLGRSDYSFILSSVGDYPEAYKSINKIPIKTSITKESIKLYKSSKMSSCKNQFEYRNTRLGVLGNRIRYAANAVLKDYSFIVYIDAGNNFCTLPQPQIGDGRMFVKIDFRSRLTYYTFGGMPLKKEEFEDIVRSIYDKDI